MSARSNDDSGTEHLPVLESRDHEQKMLIAALEALPAQQARVRLFHADASADNWKAVTGIGRFTLECREGKPWIVVRDAEDTSRILLEKDPANVRAFSQQQGGKLVSCEEPTEHWCLSFQHARCCDLLWGWLRREFSQNCAPDISDEYDREDDERLEGDTTEGSLEMQREAGAAAHKAAVQLLEMPGDAPAAEAQFFHAEFAALQATLSDDSALGMPPCPQDARGFRLLESRLRGLENLRHMRDLLHCLIRHVTSSAWLSKCRVVLDTALASSDVETLAAAGTFVLRILSLCSLLCNPFSDECLDVEDPLVQLLNDDNLGFVFASLGFEEKEQSGAGNGLEHVEWLRSVAQHHRVWPDCSQSFVKAAELVYRLTYLRDACLARRQCEEAMAQRVSTIISCGYVFLWRQLQADERACAALRDLIPQTWEAAAILVQFQAALRTNLAAAEERGALSSMLRAGRVLEQLAGYFAGDCEAARAWPASLRQHQLRLMAVESTAPGEASMLLLTLPALAAEMLAMAAEQNAHSVRQAMLNSRDPVTGQSRLWNAMVCVYWCCDNEGVHTLVADIFRKILEPPGRDAPADYEDFLALFYERGVVDELISFALLPTPDSWEELLADAASERPQFTHPNILSMTELPPEWDMNWTAESCSVSSHDSSTPYLPVYRKFINWHTYRHAVTEDEKLEVLTAVRRRQDAAKVAVVEFLSTCVLFKSARFKLRTLDAQLHVRLLREACSGAILNIPLATAATRYLKACLRTQDLHYHRLFARDGVLEYVVLLLIDGVARPYGKGEGTLLEASLLDLLAHVCLPVYGGPMPPLMRHLLETCHDQLVQLSNIYEPCDFRAFKQLLLRRQLVASNLQTEWAEGTTGDRYFNDSDDESPAGMDVETQRKEAEKLIDELLQRPQQKPQPQNISARARAQKWFTDDDDDDDDNVLENL